MEILIEAQPQMKHKPLPLTENEVLKLEEIARKSADWRSRDRAKTLLLLSRGVSVRTDSDRGTGYLQENGP